MQWPIGNTRQSGRSVMHFMGKVCGNLSVNNNLLETQMFEIEKYVNENICSFLTSMHGAIFPDTNFKLRKIGDENTLTVGKINVCLK